MTLTLTCKQCGSVKPDNGWTICASCETRNIEYRKSCDELSIALQREFQRSPPCRQMPHELRRPSELRGRKARPAVLAPYLKDEGDDD